MLTQVFSNLLVNAVKYLSKDRPGKIRVTGKVCDTECIYCLEDNGIGISENHQPRIFEIFHRLNPQDSEGQGLGLTIARRAVDRNNGRIWVQSEEGIGSKFFIALSIPADK